jgi:energy-coupling factor transporter transmembrane protein EcfT
LTKTSKPAERQTRKAAKRVSAPDERPPAPWGNAPLAELVILAGIVSLAIGAIGGHPMAIGVGVALAGLGGLEVAVREHFAGFRSHTTLLAGAAFVLVTGLVFYAAGQILAVALGFGAAAFLLAFFLARRAFQRASGGLSYRVGGMRG